MNIYKNHVQAYINRVIYLFLQVIHFSICYFQCVPILGRGFDTGGYKCECLQGYEYPFEDLITYYDGQLVEAEFSNIVHDRETRIDMFTCRLAGAAAMQTSITVFIAMILAIFKFR